MRDRCRRLHLIQSVGRGHWPQHHQFRPGLPAQHEETGELHAARVASATAGPELLGVPARTGDVRAGAGTWHQKVGYGIPTFEINNKQNPINCCFVSTVNHYSNYSKFMFR